jgi:hypothetical protein
MYRLGPTSRLESEPRPSRGEGEHERGRDRRRREQPHGGRLYFLEIPGKMDRKACSFKEEDAADKAVRFWQASYDSQNKLVEVHKTFPIDLGQRPPEGPQR